jgi:zinc protease
LCLSYLFYLLLVPCFVSANNSVVELPAGITQHSTVEGITEYRLDNGLTVLLLPDNSQTLVTVNMTYRVGSKHENYGETGMAHLLEHLLFKGTPSIPDLSEAMNRRGFKMNGTTYFDRTNYYETFNANPAHLAWAIQMEADRMVNSFIAKKDLDSEMNVVWDELRRGENSPARILGQRMMSVAFDWHNYGKSTVGTPSDLNNVPIEALRTFYKQYYQPDNAVLSIAGRIQTKDTLALIAQAFKDIPKPVRLLTQRHTTEPTQEGERRIVLRRTGDTPILTVLH